MVTVPGFSEKDLGDLALDMKESYDKKLAPFRKQRQTQLAAMLGTNYGKAPGAASPVNLMELAATTYRVNLVARTPQVDVSTTVEELKPVANMFRLTLNQELKRLKGGDTFGRGIMQALFAPWGCLKVGLSDFDIIPWGNGYQTPRGSLIIDVVDFDCLLVDMNATRMQEVRYIGDRYVRSLRDMQADEFLDQDAVKLLGAGAAPQNGGSGVKSFSQGDFKERSHDPDVYVWDVWLPREGLLLTMSDDNGPDKVLRVAEWDGPANGPYHLLGFCDVPGNLPPLPNSSLWFDLHDATNLLAAKGIRQAKRQRNLTLARGGATGDADNIRMAADGDTIGVTDPAGVVQASYGGIDNSTQAMVIYFKQLFTYMAGNLDTLGGLAPQADTLGQEQLMVGNSSVRISDMREHVQRWIAEVCQAAAWWIWTDPEKTYNLVYRIPDTEIDVPLVFGPEARERADFFLYNVDIVTYSLQEPTPDQKMQAMDQVMQTVLLPALPLMQQQGLTIDFQAYLKLKAESRGLKELPSLIKMADGQAMQAGQGAATPPGTSAIRGPTVRRYEHVSRPGAKPSGVDETMMTKLMGSDMQPAQGMGTMGRSQE